MTATTAPTAPARPARAGAVPVAFTGSWPAVAAWAAGLVVAALGAGGVTGPAGTLASRTVALVVFLFGVAALAWGTTILVRGRMLLARAAVAGTAGAVVAVAALLMLAPAHTSVIASGVAVGLLLVVAAIAAYAQRHPRAGERTASVWGLILAAAVLSVVVTPALGATQDAVLLRDDGTVPVVTHH